MKPGSERRESWSERNFAQKAPLSVPFLFVRAYTPVLIAELNINHFWGGDGPYNTIFTEMYGWDHLWE